MIEEWLKKFGTAWMHRDAQAAADLFSKDVEYYESALEKPVNWNSVVNLWKVVPENQKKVKFEFSIVSSEGDTSVVNWKMSRTLMPSEQHQDIDGIFIIKLNAEGLCSYFKQWREVKE